MGGRSGHLHGVSAPWDGHDVATRLRVAHQTQVRGFVSDGRVNGLGPLVLDVEMRGGMAGGEGLLQPAHFGQANGIDGSHPDRAFDAALQSLQLAQESVLPPQDIPAEIVVELSRRRWFQGAAAAIEQTHLEATFHLVKVLASCRLTYIAVCSPFAYALGCHYLFENTNTNRNHRAILT